MNTSETTTTARPLHSIEEGRTGRRPVVPGGPSPRPRPHPRPVGLSGPSRGFRSPEEVAELVRAAADGDQHSWAALVQEFARLVTGVARAHRLRDADADDVSQTTWLRLLEHLDKLNDPTRVGAWLATTARRECLRVLRDGDRHVLVGDDGPEPESSQVAPVVSLIEAERKQAMRRGFAALGERDQALLTKLMAEPRPGYEQIAADLNMPIGSIGPTRARALERLARVLDGQGSLTLLAA